MKKAFIFPMLAIAAMGLVACNNPAPSSSSSHATGLSSSESTSSTITYSITINNKTALTEEWHLGQAPRSLDLVCPGVNISAAIMSGDITITSSDATVATVNGTLITPLKAGKATITVAYKTASDTVEIDVGEKLGESNYVSGKTLADLMAVDTADLVVDGSNFRGKEAYLIKVKVAKVGNKKDGSASADQYGNMWVVGTDEEPAADGSNFVQVYGSSASIDALAYNDSIQAYKFPGKKDYLTNDDTKGIKPGDILDVIAIRADYNTTKEISFVIRAVNGKLLNNANRTTGQVNATEYSPNIAKQLITVSGKITGWAANKTDATKYGNFYMATVGENGEVPENAVPVYVYGATASTTKAVEGGDPLPVIQMKDDGSFKFNNPQDFLTNEATKDLAIGDMVTLFGYRCDYQGTLELTGIVSKYVEPKTSLENIENGDKVNLDGVTVVAEIPAGYVVSDGTRSIYVVKSGHGFKAGDKVKVSADVVDYHNYLRLENPEASKVSDGENLPNPVVLDAAGADALVNARGLEAAKAVTFETTVGKAGNYTTTNVAGSETVIEPSGYATGIALEQGKEYTITGYFIAYDTKYNYANIIVTGAEKKATPSTSTPFTATTEFTFGRTTCLDADGNASGVGSYTSSFYLVSGDLKLVVAGVNNGSYEDDVSADWTVVRFGRKNNDSQASFTTSTALGGTVSNFTFHFTQAKADKISSAKLYYADSEAGLSAEGVKSVNADAAIAVGDVVFTIPEADRAENLYYKVVFDLASDSGNGNQRIDKVTITKA